MSIDIKKKLNEYNKEGPIIQVKNFYTVKDFKVKFNIIFRQIS